MSLCRVDYDLARYENRLAQEDHIEERIAERAEELVEPGGDCYPFTVANLAEALGEIAAAAGMDLDRAAHQYELGNVALAGATLSYAIKRYWQDSAIKQATDEIENEPYRAMEEEDRRDHELDR